MTHRLTTPQRHKPNFSAMTSATTTTSTTINGSNEAGLGSPQPGRRAERKVWTGRYDHGDPVLLDPSTQDPKPGDQKQLKHSRITGLDVARGIALIGMVAVHTLPSKDPDGTMSPTFWLAAGNAAALFATLAGVGLAFISGGQNRASGLKLRIARKRLFIRSALIFLLGITINQVFSPVVFNILPFYGLLFLVAVFFIGMRLPWLVVSTALTIIVMPIFVFVFNHNSDTEQLGNVTFVDFVQTPLESINTLLFTGAYPVATWFFYILVGMIIGRLQLKLMATQALLPFFGLVTALGTWIISYVGIWFAGGWEAMVKAEPQLSTDEVEQFIVFGAEFDYLPSNTWAWGLIMAPHANTALSILHSAGVAVFVLGLCLLLCRFIPHQISPLALVGSMTLTLYIGHQLFMTYNTIAAPSMLLFLTQLSFGVTLAYIWTRFTRQGPLEWLVAKISKGGDALLESRASRRERIEPSEQVSVSELTG